MSAPEAKSNMEMTAADALVRVLRAAGVEHIFGMPGDHAALFDSIMRDGGIRHVLIRHEQAGAHAADGYARASGRIGVCDANSGPGATNLITAIGEAYASSIPILAIASSARKAIRGRNVFQDLDQVALFRPVTKATYDVTEPGRIAEFARRAILKATSGRPGPVVLNIPTDVLAAKAVYDPSEFEVPPGFGCWPMHRPEAPAEAAQAVAERLRAAKRPVIWCGGGVISSGAAADVQALAELTGIGVATTYMGKGSVPEDHPLSIGTMGALGRPMSNDYVRNADFILALGTRFTNLDTKGWTIPAPGTPVIQVDVDPEELGHHQRIERGICADVRSFARALVTACGQQAWPQIGRRAEVAAIRERWLPERGTASSTAAPGDGPIHPLQAIAALRDCMSAEDTIVCDSGFNQIWGGQYFEVKRGGRSYIGTRGMGVMGFGLPAAIGAAVSDPGRRFVALVGDGGFMMMIHELETARRLGVPVTVLVLNNGNLEYSKAGQHARFGGRSLSCDFAPTDFAAIGRAFGCDGVAVEQAADLRPVIAAALASGRPTVVDVRTVATALPDGVGFA